MPNKRKYTQEEIANMIRAEMMARQNYGQGALSDRDIAMMRYPRSTMGAGSMSDYEAAMMGNAQPYGRGMGSMSEIDAENLKAVKYMRKGSGAMTDKELNKKRK